MGGTRAQKEAYFVKLRELIDANPSIFLVNVDNVGSNQSASRPLGSSFV